MKASFYNYIYENGEYSYWYNGLHQSFFRLNKSTGCKLIRFLSTPQLLKEASGIFYRKLIDNGFLVQDDVNEIDIIRQKNVEAINSKDALLIVLPTLNCNFQCWYCIQEHIESAMSADVQQKVMRHIDQLIDIEKIESLRLEWFGGEPFLYFKEVVSPVTTYAKNRCLEADIPFYASATTNGYYLTSDLYAELVNLKFDRFQITIDGPREIHNKVKCCDKSISTFDRTLNNINNLLAYFEHVQLLLRFNFTVENAKIELVDQVSELISEENKSKILIMPKKVWQEEKSDLLSVNVERIKKGFEEKGFNVCKLDLIFNFVPCYACQKHYNAINYNGHVVKCTAHDDLYSKEPPGMLQSDGTVVWKENFFRQFDLKLFENKRCLACKYLPVCMGACPREYQSNEQGQSFRCKQEGVLESIKDSIIGFIDHEYEKTK